MKQRRWAGEWPLFAAPVTNRVILGDVVVGHAGLAGCLVPWCREPAVESTLSSMEQDSVRSHAAPAITWPAGAGYLHMLLLQPGCTPMHRQHRSLAVAECMHQALHGWAPACSQRIWTSMA